MTGASRGIGRATAIRLAEAGANVVVNYFQHEAEALAVVRECHNFGVKAVAFQADVSKPIDAERLNEAALREFGGVDIVIANAGIWEGDAVEAMTEDVWDRVIDANLKGTWTICKAVIPHFKAMEAVRSLSYLRPPDNAVKRAIQTTRLQKGDRYHLQRRFQTNWRQAFA
ncbi:MAG: SDR family NAD(P)-dependent oxidoreductase [Chloracidobacterium sp.]|nr:SDR family NAD(P)-dependent oxidoreductase [Chloracidobacterium sp.]